MGFIESMATQLGTSALGAGMGMMMGKQNDERQREQQAALQGMQEMGNKRMMDYSYAKQLQMWKDTNYKAQVKEMKNAGINPGLLYGMSGGGGTTAGSGGGQISGGSAQQNPGEVQGMTGMGLQMGQMAAQTALLQAQTEKAKTETTKIAGPDTANVEADTGNKILQQIITRYMGQEAADQYNKIKAPNRNIEAKTYEDELAARQGVAGTIYEMWVDGKLAEKSIAEVEQLLLQNAKTRTEKSEIMLKMEMLEQNIKGGKLDNIIKELESKLQTQTGIDRNSPAWMKILGRLFVQLMGGK